MFNSTPWQIFCVPNLASEAAEMVSNHLIEQQALAVSLIDSEDIPIFEPAPGSTPLWQRTTVKALFATENYNHQQLCQALDNILDHATLTHAYSTPLDEQHWSHAWQQHAPSKIYNHQLMVHPSHITPPIQFQGTTLMLDPGLAFGSGTHPTTQLCLEWLAQQEDMPASMIDYGCGSGILAIAAKKLGCQRIWATDIDPQALLATQANADNNQLLTDNFHVVTPAQLPTQPVDMIVANILLNTLKSLRSEFFRLLKPGGTLLMSGVLSEQIELLIDNYKTEFCEISVQMQENWGLVTAKKAELAFTT